MVAIIPNSNLTLLIIIMSVRLCPASHHHPDHPEDWREYSPVTHMWSVLTQLTTQHGCTMWPYTPTTQVWLPATLCHTGDGDKVPGEKGAGGKYCNPCSVENYSIHRISRLKSGIRGLPYTPCLLGIVDRDLPEIYLLLTP